MQRSLEVQAASARSAVVKADLLDDHAILELKDGRSSEPHGASAIGWK